MDDFRVCFSVEVDSVVGGVGVVSVVGSSVVDGFFVGFSVGLLVVSLVVVSVGETVVDGLLVDFLLVVEGETVVGGSVDLSF